MKKVLAVFGTRPEAIKMCPLVKELKKRKEVQTVVCVTGQHRSILDSVLDTFSVKPEYDLSVMKQNQTLYDVTCGVLTGMKRVLDIEKPDIVLVHGDTTTAFSASLACFYARIPVGHVEAGLRTGDVYSPYPEEFNRRAISITAKYNFAPTKAAAENLFAERADPNGVFITGNTAIDALKTTVRDGYRSDILDWCGSSRFLLITAHRRENLGEPMREMFAAIKEAVEAYPDVKAVYPVHPNPAVKSVAEEVFGGCAGIKLTPPLDVVDFHNLMARSCLIMTDSGGIQEEAPSLGKPVIVMRDTTERPEGVAAGTLRLAGTGKETILSAVRELLDSKEAYEKMSRASNPYGDGRACERIADVLTKGTYSPFDPEGLK